MGNTLQSYFEKYRYSLKGPLGILYISDPIGWNEDNKVFKRSNDVHGVFTSLSSNLEFYKGDEENEEMKGGNDKWFMLRCGSIND